MNHGESTVIETVNAAKPNFKKEELLNAMKYRYATKRFSEKTIPPEDFEVLLETARLAPTSFGLETWKILVIQDKTLREEMKEFGWGIKDKLDASHFVVFLARKKADITFGSDYIRHMLKDVHQVPDEVYEFYRNAYGNFSENDFKTLESERSAFDWAGKQAYIVMAHMMAVAALMGIDSCPLERNIAVPLSFKFCQDSYSCIKKEQIFKSLLLLRGIIPGKGRRRCRGG